jgi:hypothetical protein
MSANLRQEQDDFAGRMAVDPYFSQIATFVQHKGVTENDIQTALAVLNQNGGKLGACVIVLMPVIVPDPKDGIGIEYFIQETLQVIEQPIFNLGPTGTQKNAEEIAEYLRGLLRVFTTGLGGTYVFDGMEPIPRDAGQISYGVKFKRLSRDARPAKVATPILSSNSPSAPANVTITCATAGAGIWYTLDGTYPSSVNPSATHYTAPFNQGSACTVRAAAEYAGLQQSNISQLVLS